MSKAGNDSRIVMWPYRKALERVETQFELIRFALRHLSRSKIAEFFQRRADNERLEDEALLNEWKQEAPVGFEKIEKTLREFNEAEIQGKFGPGEHHVNLEVSEDRLNQSELLLLVAHFESFMKLIHETFLRACPAKVFAHESNNKEVLMRKIFDPSLLKEQPLVSDEMLSRARALFFRIPRECFNVGRNKYPNHFGEA